MGAWTDTVISPEATLIEAIRCLDKSSAQICLVCDSSMRLVGTVTDGDIRRGLLKGLALETRIAEVMNGSPLVRTSADTADVLRDLMSASQLRHVPIVDHDNRIVDLVSWTDLNRSPRTLENWVVLMAGGKGSRLRPLTDDIPKPLLNVGRKPLLESTLEALLRFGFHRFYISVNYKADMLKSHFGDGARWGCEIRYLEEETHLGTAGSLGLLPDTPKLPLVVMNADVLTKVNFGNLLEFHRAQEAIATMCVREYEITIPYGVVDIENHRIRGLAEKPTHRSFVNAGIYVLDPSALASVPRGERFDMTDLFSKFIATDRKAAAFPIWEYWIDVGQMGDFQKANIDYPQVFAQ